MVEGTFAEAERHVAQAEAYLRHQFAIVDRLELRQHMNQAALGREHAHNLRQKRRRA